MSRYTEEQIEQVKEGITKTLEIMRGRGMGLGHCSECYESGMEDAIKGLEEMGMINKDFIVLEDGEFVARV